MLACGPASVATPSTLPTPTALATPSATPSGTPDAFDLDLIELAGGDDTEDSDLDRFWRDVLSMVRTDDRSEYSPPKRLVSYTGGETPASPCGLDTPLSFWSENASYCRADNSILYDETWLRDMAERSGEFAPYAVIAHEWGHHIQEILGIDGESLQLELQADCMSGVFLANALPADAADPTRGLEDMDAAMTAFFNLGNREYDASSWFQANEHGSPIQRITAFATGVQASLDMPDYDPPLGRGLSWCYGYRDYRPADFIDVGGFRLLKPPGRQVERNGNTVILLADNRLGYETSAIELTWFDNVLSSEAVELAYPAMASAFGPGNLSGSLPDSDGSSYVVQQAADPDRPARSGVWARIVPREMAGELIVFAYRKGLLPAETEPDAFARVAESYVAVGAIGYRLCGEWQSGQPGDPDFNSLCMADQ
jgi:hypothetical protein